MLLKQRPGGTRSVSIVRWDGPFAAELYRRVAAPADRTLTRRDRIFLFVSRYRDKIWEFGCAQTSTNGGRRDRFDRDIMRSGVVNRTGGGAEARGTADADVRFRQRAAGAVLHHTFQVANNGKGLSRSGACRRRAAAPSQRSRRTRWSSQASRWMFPSISICGKHNPVESKVIVNYAGDVIRTNWS